MPLWEAFRDTDLRVTALSFVSGAVLTLVLAWLI